MVKQVKHGHKKEKIKKSSLLYNVKTSEDKKERNLNEGKVGLKPSFKREKTKMLSTRRYRIYMSQKEKPYMKTLKKYLLTLQHY